MALLGNIIQGEIFQLLRRSVYSSIIIHLRRTLDKYCQWRAFSISLTIFCITGFFIGGFLHLILPFTVVWFMIIYLVIFLCYWNKRLTKLKRLGRTKNSKSWNDMQFWYGLSGWRFEEEVADIFEKNGFSTYVTKGSCDGGVDIIMHKRGQKYIVQCKNYHGHYATPQELRALWGVKDDNEADFVVMVASDGISKAGYSYISNKPNFKILTLPDIIALSK